MDPAEIQILTGTGRGPRSHRAAPRSRSRPRRAAVPARGDLVSVTHPAARLGLSVPVVPLGGGLPPAPLSDSPPHNRTQDRTHARLAFAAQGGVAVAAAAQRLLGAEPRAPSSPFHPVGEGSALGGWLCCKSQTLFAHGVSGGRQQCSTCVRATWWRRDEGRRPRHAPGVGPGPPPHRGLTTSPPSPGVPGHMPGHEAMC